MFFYDCFPAHVHMCVENVCSVVCDVRCMHVCVQMHVSHMHVCREQIRMAGILLLSLRQSLSLNPELLSVNEPQ